MDNISVSVSEPSVKAGRTIYASEYSFDGTSATSADSILYRVDDITAGTSVAVRAWTTAAAGDSTSIILENEDTALLTSSDFKELRRVTFQVTQGATVLSGEATYFVTNYYVTNLGQPTDVISLNCDMTHELERYSPLPSSRISRVVDLDNWNP